MEPGVGKRRRLEARERDERDAEAEARERQDGAYFHSYSDVSIHEEMIADAARTGSYRRALQRGWRAGRPEPGPGAGLLRGLTVLEVGAGTGILSIFCAQAGAARVYAAEASVVMAERAREVVAANGLSGRVRIVRGRVEEARLPERVDAIVSEWMGYGLMYEAMLRSVLHARDRWLKPGGLLFPCRAELYLAPVTDPGLQERLSFWAGVRQQHGVDMACMATFARRCLMNDEVAVGALHGEDVLARPCQFATIDLYTVTEQQLGRLGGPFTASSFGIATMHAFAVWFSVIFPATARTSGANADGHCPTGVNADGQHAANANGQHAANADDQHAANANGQRAANADHQHAANANAGGQHAANADNANADHQHAANADGPRIAGANDYVPSATGANADDQRAAGAIDDGPRVAGANDDGPRVTNVRIISANADNNYAVTANGDGLHAVDACAGDHMAFDANADDLEPVVLSTSPFAEETHWKQSLLYLDEPVQVFQDTVIKGKITLTPAEDNPRHLRVALTYEIGDSGKKTKIFKMGEDFCFD